MNAGASTYLVKAIRRYMRLFGARVVDINIIDNRVVEGVAVWRDSGDEQAIRWKNNKTRQELKLMEKVVKVIWEEQLIRGDRITVSPGELIDQLIKSDWTRKRADEALHVLCDMEVKMIDDGWPTDSFFVHF